MPIGSELNVTLPAVGDSAAVAAARIIDTFEKVIEAIEGAVPSSAFDIVSDVDMQAHRLTHVAGAQFDNVADPDTAQVGEIFRYNNDMWFVHPDGAFRWTDGAGLNAAGIGGIGGDYGSGEEEVVYDAGNDVYIFTDGPGDFSELEVEAVRLMGDTTGYVRLVAHSSVNSDTSWLFVEPAAVTSGIVVQTSAGVTGCFGGTQDPFEFFGDVTFTAAVIRTGQQYTKVPTSTNLSTSGWVQVDDTTLPIISTGVECPTGGGQAPLVVAFEGHQGDTISDVRIVTSGGNGTDTFEMRAYIHNGSTGVTIIGTATPAIPGIVTVHDLTVTPTVLGSGESLIVTIWRATGTASGVIVHSVTETITEN